MTPSAFCLLHGLCPNTAARRAPPENPNSVFELLSAFGDSAFGFVHNHPSPCPSVDPNLICRHESETNRVCFCLPGALFVAGQGRATIAFRACGAAASHQRISRHLGGRSLSMAGGSRGPARAGMDQERERAD